MQGAGGVDEAVDFVTGEHAGQGLGPGDLELLER